MKTAAVETPSIAASRHSFVSDLAELVKARLTLLVVGNDRSGLLSRSGTADRL